jgi:uncharacterized lipoprotein YehR (DUF1307 family)
LFIALGIFLTTIQSCDFFHERGAATREELVSTYLRALEKKDAQVILNLIPEDYAAKQVVEEKINRLGDRKLELLTISYQELQKPDSIKVIIEGSYYDKPLPNGKRFQSMDQLFIHASGNRWYLILGKQKPPVD